MNDDKPWNESLEDEATIWQDSVNDDGEIIQVGAFSLPAMRKAQRARIKRGEGIIQPFATWLVANIGLTDPYARKTAILAWAIYDETKGDPVSVLHNSTLPYRTFIQIRSCLSRFATWLSTRQKGTDSTRKIGRRISNELMKLPGDGKSRATPRKRKKDKSPPYTESEEKSLYLATEIVRDRYGTRWPWLWACARFLLRTGAPLQTLLYLKRSDAMYALRRHRAGEPAGLPLWAAQIRTKASNGARLIPISLVEEEITTLVYWPFDWGILADMIAPTMKPERRVSVATHRLTARMREIFAEAGIPWDRRTRFRIRNTALRRIYSETNDLILLQQISGITASLIKRTYWFSRIGIADPTDDSASSQSEESQQDEHPETNKND